MADDPTTTGPKAARKRAPRKSPAKAAPARKARGKKGRARGKRSDPAFTQITAYLRKSDLPDFKAKLAKAGLDMSGFFQEKVDEYLSI